MKEKEEKCKKNEAAFLCEFFVSGLSWSWLDSQAIDASSFWEIAHCIIAPKSQIIQSKLLFFNKWFFVGWFL